MDKSKPTLTFVNDGFVAPDITSQSMTNVLLANYNATDAESGIWKYEVAFATSNDTALEPDVVAWRAAGDKLVGGVVEGPFLKPLVAGMKVYSWVRAYNLVGEMSDALVSNGVLVGKTEAPVPPDRTTAMQFDTKPAPVNEDSSDNDSAPPANSGTTIGAVAFPPGAVSEATNFIAGAVDEEDISSGDAVEPAETQPPANNFKFGDYSFAIKATDDDGNVVENFQFNKPMYVMCLLWLRVAPSGL